jgi:hypothetical protein
VVDVGWVGAVGQQTHLSPETILRSGGRRTPGDDPRTGRAVMLRQPPAADAAAELRGCVHRRSTRAGHVQLARLWPAEHCADAGKKNNGPGLTLVEVGSRLGVWSRPPAHSNPVARAVSQA